MWSRVGVLRAVTATLLMAGAAAQQPPPQPPPTQPPRQDPKPKPEKPVTEPPKPDKPIDAARAAAEILRRALGLDRGPTGQPPKGPPARPPQPEPQQPAAGEAAQGAQDPQGKPQPLPGAPPLDPAQAAARAIQKLLPHAKPPRVPPIADRTGAPEPVLPTAPGAPPPLPVATATTASPPPVALPWRGSWSTRYRARHGNGSSDQDLTTRLSLDIGIEARDPYTFHFLGHGFADLDGRRPDGTFAGLDTSFGDDVHGRIYRAHFDAHAVPHLDLLRVGRQDLDATPTPVTFDGLRVDTERFGAARWFVSAYGGVPVHHFESSPSGDSVFGLGAGLVPWPAARVRLDWMSLRDEFLALDRHDELLGARWWQRFENVRLRGTHTWRDGRPKDLHLGAQGDLPLPLTFALNYRELLTTQRAAVTALDPYFAIAAEYRPYRQLDLSLSRDFAERWSVNVATAVRRLNDRSDEAAFNREFERTYADVAVRDVGLDGMTVSLSGSLWNSQGEKLRTLAGEIEYRPARTLRVALGSAYDLFRYDVFLDRERVHVRSLYLRTDWRCSDRVRLDAAYEYDRDDDDEFHMFRLGVTCKL